jgi:serine/threonine protein kinase
MGEVYEAVRVDDFQKQVAIKIIRREFDSDFLRARFQRERQVLATLEHPYIARLLDGGSTPGGSPYLVMEYIEGEPITEHCARKSGTPRRRVAEVIELFEQVCQAVDYAHQKSVVHRDIKPANILVTTEGIPKLLDFGIAREEGWIQQNPALTSTGFVIGSISYMSPEQARGMRVDARSDIFSLGVVLYELLCGRRPFAADNASEALAALLSPEPAPRTESLEELSPPLAALLARALRKERTERFSAVAEMLAELKQVQRMLEREESGTRKRRKEAQQSALAQLAPLRITLFGSLRITRGDELVTSVNTNRLQSLLAFLVLHGDSIQSREHLSFLLWPGSSEPQARTNLRQLIHNLRRALPDECRLLLAADNHTMQWRRDPACAVDVLEFTEAIAHAEEAGKRGDSAAELRALEEAVRLYQDDLLRELYDEWLQPQRDEYKRQVSQALGRLATLCEARRNYAPAIGHAERLVTQDPLRESHHQLLIRLHLANSDRASALRAYHQCVRILRRELGVQPGAATRELFEQALKSETAPASAVELPPTVPASPLPMIGRRNEWQKLIECWQAAVSGGTLLALIPGEPGIGKSRLAEELFQWCSGTGAAVARARCYAAQGQLAYAPIAEWLRAQPLREATSQLSPLQLAELARVLPEVLTENPAIEKPPPMTQSWERRHFYDSLGAAFEKARKPLLLVIDDLQWCDQESLEWLPSLFHSGGVESALTGGILIVGTLRPEETDRNHPFTKLWNELQPSGRTVELPLTPLNSEETATLAAQIADRQVKGADLAQLYGATKGNPLFVIESVRAGPAGLAAAPRVQAVIASRLARLSSTAYELAGLAGAIGRAFSFDLLAKATDWDEDSLSRALEELWQRRVIEGKGDASGQYDFTHDRLREVAYAELSPVRQRYLHRRLGRALEELHGTEIESVSGQIAAHSEAAGLAEQAIRYYQVAATVASQRFADAEAAGLLKRALALCRGLPESVKRQELELVLLVSLARSLFTTLGYAAAEVGEACTDALALFRVLGAKQHGLAVLSSAWVFRIVRAEIEVSRQLGQELLDLGAGNPDDPCSMAGQFVLGSSYFHLGDFGRARLHMERAMEFPQLSDAGVGPFAVAEVGRAYLPHALWHLGYPDSASKTSEEVLAYARESHPFGLAIALNYTSMLKLFARDSAQALRYAEEASRLCSHYDFAYYESMANIFAGWAMAMQENADTGLAQIREGFDALKATGAELRLPFYHGLIAEACARGGKTGEAWANVSSGLAFQSKSGEIWAASYLHRIQGDLSVEAGNEAEARDSYERAITAARQTGARMMELRALTQICRLRHAPNASVDHRAALRSLYLQFTEGLETRELNEARSLVLG